LKQQTPLKITHLITVPKPKISKTDALWNEAYLLSEKFNGECRSIFPLKIPTSLIPRDLIGLGEIFKKKDQDIIHVHSPYLYYFPMLKYLKVPIIYSVATSIEPRYLKKIRQLKKIEKIVVSSDNDKEKLHQLGFRNAISINPGLDLSYIKEQAKRTRRNPFNILMASAPWEKNQISKKGYPIIFQFLKDNTDFHLTILLRGSFEKELKDLASKYEVSNKCIFVNEKVDINQFLKTCDATLLITNQQEIIKSYPHSLLESIAAHKPIIISENIALGAFTKKFQCGVSLKNFEYSELRKIILELKDNYDFYQAHTIGLKSHFKVENWLEAYEDEYRKLSKIKN